MSHISLQRATLCTRTLESTTHASKKNKNSVANFSEHFTEAIKHSVVQIALHENVKNTSSNRVFSKHAVGKYLSTGARQRLQRTTRRSFALLDTDHGALQAHSIWHICITLHRPFQGTWDFQAGRQFLANTQLW